MKILYLRTYFKFNLKAGGSVGHTAGVINALSRKVNIRVVSNDFLPEVNIPVEIINAYRVEVGLLNNILELIYNLKLKRILKSEIKDYQAIYHRYTGNSFIAAYFAKRFEIPLLLEFNSSAVWGLKNWDIKQKFPKNLIRFIFNRLIRLPYTIIIEKYNLKHCSVVIVVSEVMKENLLDMGVADNKILVNPNGVDPVKFSPDIESSRIREKFDLAEKLVFGFIGTFGQWHGIVELAKAIDVFYTRSPENMKNTHFLLMGDGVLMSDVQEITSNSIYADHITLTGLIPQELAPAHLAACDVYLSPHVPNPDGTKFFGSPTKLFEYMAMGKPIIASNLEQIGDLLSHLETAYLVEPGNINMLAEAMDYIARNKGIREKLGSSTRNNVLKLHTWERHVENILTKLSGID